eukprot:gene17690-biopygen12905
MQFPTELERPGYNSQQNLSALHAIRGISQQVHSALHAIRGISQQCRSVQCGAVHCSAVLCSAVQCNAGTNRFISRDPACAQHQRHADAARNFEKFRGFPNSPCVLCMQFPRDPQRLACDSQQSPT